MAKITLHITPMDAAELSAITRALAPFVSSGTPAVAEQPAPQPKRRATRKAKQAEEPKAEEPKAVPPTESAHSTGQPSGGEGFGSREALLDAMRNALKAGKRAEVSQVLQEFGAARATELKDEDVAAATAMVVAL